LEARFKRFKFLWATITARSVRVMGWTTRESEIDSRQGEGFKSFLVRSDLFWGPQGFLSYPIGGGGGGG
jgi:hypothetical protein